MMQRKYHTNGSLPTRGEIFVFGSNLQGVHGAGAAKVALELFGAHMGFGKGRCRQSFAIPTRNYNRQTRQVTTLSLMEIRNHIQSFCEATHLWPDIEWWVTAVGCGRAGLHPRQIAPLFKDAINCSFPMEWQQYLEDE